MWATALIIALDVRPVALKVMALELSYIAYGYSASICMQVT